MRRFDVSEYIDEELQFADRSEALALFARKADEFGAKHLIYGILDPGKNSGTLPFDAVTTYSLDWQHRYFMQRYFLTDPILAKTRASRVPFDWAANRYEDRDTQRFFGESREFGVGNQGVCIPLHGPEGELCGFSFNVNMGDREWQGYKNEVLPHLFLFAHHFHANALDIRQPKLDEISLSERETEVLKWAAEGKSMQDTADILKISQHSVRTYLQNCQRKLSGANKLHTVVLAIRAGIIK